MKPQQPSNRIAVTKGAKSAPKGKDNNKFIYILFPFGRRFLCLNQKNMNIDTLSIRRGEKGPIVGVESVTYAATYARGEALRHTHFFNKADDPRCDPEVADVVGRLNDAVASVPAN